MVITMGRKKRYDKRGRPVHHPKILILETGEVCSSYNEVAKKVGGNRGNVYLCLIGMRRNVNGYHFRYLRKDEKYE